MTAAPDPGRPDDAETDRLDEDEPRREASVRLQVAGAGGGEAALREAMDPANQSLADALRLSYRVLQLAILGLLVTFLFSGFQTVQEGYTGVRTVFGRIDGEGADAQLAPGLEPFWPYPVGEIVVFELKRSTSLRTEFWPRLQGTLQRAIESADLNNPIRPGADGSVITADGDLAHLQVTAEYSIDDVSRYVSNVDRARTETMVRKAIARGVVMAAAATPLNDLLADREEPMRARRAGTAAGGAGGATGAGDGAPNGPGTRGAEGSGAAPAGGAAAPSTGAAPAGGQAPAEGERPRTGDGAAATGADGATPPGAAPANGGSAGAPPAAGDGATAPAGSAAAADAAGAESSGRWSARRGELEELIRRRAQEVLDDLQCGIRITSLSVPERVAPLPVENRFSQVQVDRETAKETVNRARQAARSKLVDVAGPAYPEILEGVRRYEAALHAGQLEESEKILDAIGERLSRPDIGGEVAVLMNQARAYKGAIDSTLGAEARRLEGYSNSFRDNPRQLVRQLWLDSIRGIFTDSRDEIEVFSVPPEIASVRLAATSSPDVMQARREAELARKKAQADAAGAMMRPFNVGVRGMGDLDKAGRMLNQEGTRGFGR